MSGLVLDTNAFLRLRADSDRLGPAARCQRSLTSCATIFDPMLLAQAQAEGLDLLTSDRVLLDLELEWMWDARS